MTHETCAAFIRSSTNDNTVGPDDQRVNKVFTSYDSDHDGKLTKDDFLEFYRQSSISRVDIVWTNIIAHNYGNDLKPINFQANDENDPLELKDKTLLIRYKLPSK